VPLQGVCFDAAGTLFTVREPVGVTYARFGRRHGLEIGDERLGAGFRGALGAAPPLAFPGAAAGDLDRRERAWWHRVVCDTFAHAGARGIPSALFEELYAHYASGSAWRCYEDTIPALIRLRRRQLRLGLISNFDSRLARIAVDLGIAECLDILTDSASVGAAKPDPLIFRHTLGALGLTPREAAHVGDSRTADVEGARAAGLLAVLIDRSGVQSDPPPGVPVISSLADLEDVLGRL
jgi:putative hydrolase of the HAD superfamily